MTMLRQLQAIAALLVLPLCAGTVDAARIYRLVDYLDLQNGHTVTGTITTTDEAPEDGLLETDEIVDWEWEVSDGAQVTVGLMHPTQPHSVSITESVGIGIDSEGIYFPHELGNILRLQIATNLNSRGSNMRRLAWFDGSATPFSKYVFNGVTEGDILFRAWGSDLPTEPARWLIAERVPEPSGLALACCVITCAVAVLRGWRK